MLAVPPLELPFGGPLARPIPRPLMLDKSCVLYMDLVDRASKVKAWDESGQGNHGAITGATWSPDGMVFDGTDDYLVIDYNANMDPLLGDNPFTFFQGIKFTQLASVAAHNMYAFDQVKDGTKGRIWLMTHNTALAYAAADEFVTHIGAANIGTNVISVVDRWYFITIRYDGTTMEIWCDNVLGDTKAASTTQDSVGNYHVGTSRTFGGDFNGSVNLIALFNRKFSDVELTNMYNLYKEFIGEV